MERLDHLIKFNHAQLVEDVKKYVFPLGEQVIQGEEYETPAYHGFGGWSLLSRSGDWRDGWDFFQNDDGEAMETYFPKNVEVKVAQDQLLSETVDEPVKGPSLDPMMQSFVSAISKNSKK